MSNSGLAGRKTLIKSVLCFVLLAGFVLPFPAQSLQVQTPKAPTIAAPLQKKPLATNQPLKLPAPRNVLYSGAVVELARSGRPLKALSLRNPADPARDGTNVVTGLRAETGRGIRLFSLDF